MQNVSGNYQQISGDVESVGGMGHVIDGNVKGSVSGMNHTINGNVYGDLYGMNHIISGCLYGKEYGSGHSIALKNIDPPNKPTHSFILQHTTFHNDNFSYPPAMFHTTIGQIVYNAPTQTNEPVPIAIPIAQAKPTLPNYTKGKDDEPGQNTNDTCVICMENRRQCTNVPCGHFVMCLKCVHESAPLKCYICQAEIKQIIRIYS